MGTGLRRCDIVLGAICENCSTRRQEPRKFASRRCGGGAANPDLAFATPVATALNWRCGGVPLTPPSPRERGEGDKWRGNKKG